MSCKCNCKTMTYFQWNHQQCIQVRQFHCLETSPPPAWWKYPQNFSVHVGFSPLYGASILDMSSTLLSGKSDPLSTKAKSHTPILTSSSKHSSSALRMRNDPQEDLNDLKWNEVPFVTLLGLFCHNTPTASIHNFLKQSEKNIQHVFSCMQEEQNVRIM